MGAVEGLTKDGLMPPIKVEEVRRNLNDALSAERTRQSGAKKAEISDDQAAAHLQKVGHAIPKTRAERLVKEHRHSEFLDMSSGSNRVQ